jgi:hypothetical protein
MKKLINLIESKVTVSSLNLSNVKIDGNSSNDLISETLLTDIDTAAKNAGLIVTITTAVSGHNSMTKSGNKSRHASGNAVDISQIDGLKINTENGDKLVDELVKLGYETGSSESGKDKAILWQVPDHYNHIHVSVKDENVKPFDGEVGGENMGTGHQILKKIVTGLIGMNESKQERILKDIQKIKNLL